MVGLNSPCRWPLGQTQRNDLMRVELTVDRSGQIETIMRGSYETERNRVVVQRTPSRDTCPRRVDDPKVLHDHIYVERVLVILCIIEREKGWYFSERVPTA
jgi:hypothetical protein